MKRYTAKRDGRHVIDDDSAIHNSVIGYHGSAVDLIARLEDLVEQCERDLVETQARMDEYRAQGRERSYQFRELMGRKSMTNYLLDQLKKRVFIDGR